MLVIPDALRLSIENGIDQEAKSAKELLEAQSPIIAFQKNLRRRTDPNSQYIMADMIPEQLEMFAMTYLQALKLPPDRLRNLQKFALCGHDIAIEQRDFCRHLEIHENLDHASSPHTYYAIDPLRRCACREFGYESRVETQSWPDLIHAFKKTYCAGCTKRQPGNSSAPS